MSSRDVGRWSKYEKSLRRALSAPLFYVMKRDLSRLSGLIG